MSEYGRPALRRCIAVEPDVFARDHWGRDPLLSRASQLGGCFSDLFSMNDVDELVAARALRTPFVRMAKNGVILPTTRYTGPGGYGAEVADQLSSEKVLAEFADGATLVLQGLHRTWAPIESFARQLATDLGRGCQVNAYITPAASRGFDPHYDVHDVFVLQIYGQKRWRIHRPVIANPTSDQPWTDHSLAVKTRATERPSIEAALEPGDALYLPRGWIHSATACEGTSIHLTVGVATCTHSDVVRTIVDRSIACEALRTALPLGTDPDRSETLRRSVEQSIAALVAALQAVTIEDEVSAVCEAFSRRLSCDCPAEPVRPLQTVERLQGATAETTVVLRAGLRVSLSLDGDVARLTLPTKTVTFPAAAGSALAALSSGEAIRIKDLPRLDETSAIVVAKRLIREGVLVLP